MTASSDQSLVESLGALSFFKALDPGVLKAIARNALWREYPAGEVLFLEGEELPGFYLVKSGWFKVVKTSPEGREQVLRFFGPGETFNEIAVFANRPSPATAIALEPLGLWLLPRETVRLLLRENPDFAQQVIETMADRLVDLVGLITDLSLRPVTGRLARLLLDEAPDGVFHRPRWYTQAELAARLGTVPDVIQRALRLLETSGLIEIQRDQIILRDREALSKLAQ